MNELRQKIEREIMDTGWDMLAMHHKRDALLLVDPRCALVEVALAVAEDRASEVQAWLQAGLLTRPTPTQVETFAARAKEQRFRFVIVQPFVLAQLRPDPQSN